MYGSVSRWRIKEEHQDEFVGLLNEVMGDVPPGSLGVSVYRADTDPLEYWVAGRWESKEAYRANSNAPRQDATFRRLRELMQSDPEWHDGEIVFAQP